MLTCAPPRTEGAKDYKRAKVSRNSKSAKIGGGGQERGGLAVKCSPLQKIFQLKTKVPQWPEGSWRYAGMRFTRGCSKPKRGNLQKKQKGIYGEVLTEWAVLCSDYLASPTTAATIRIQGVGLLAPRGFTASRRGTLAPKTAPLDWPLAPRASLCLTYKILSSEAKVNRREKNFPESIDNVDRSW